MAFRRAKIEEDWRFAVSDAAIRYRVAQPEFPGVLKFKCGREWWATEITEFVHGRKWARIPVFTSLEFGLNGKSVGFAFLILKMKPHPWDSSRGREMYQLVVMVGIHEDFQRTEDPGAPFRTDKPTKRQNLSETMFRGIEEHSRSLEEKPVGLWLQVREENTWAIRFYEKFGFVKDEAKGVYTSTDKAHRPSLEMRKPL